METLNYRERLISLKMNSQERRRDRYAVIVIWKVAIGLVEGYPLEFAPATTRRGRECKVKSAVQNAPNQVKKARENSLAVKGAKMFNLLPSHIRNINSEKASVFKNSLDFFLRSVPDEPTINGVGRAAPTNCLLHQIPLLQFLY